MKIKLQIQIIKTKSLISSKLFLASVVVFAVSVIFAANGASTIYAQNEKKIIKLTPAVNSQLKIIELKIGQQERKLDENFLECRKFHASRH